MLLNDGCIVWFQLTRPITSSANYQEISVPFPRVISNEGKWASQGYLAMFMPRHVYSTTVISVFYFLFFVEAKRNMWIRYSSLSFEGGMQCNIGDSHQKASPVQTRNHKQCFNTILQQNLFDLSQKKYNFAIFSYIKINISLLLKKIVKKTRTK